jgi:hypothetical protein
VHTVAVRLIRAGGSCLVVLVHPDQAVVPHVVFGDLLRPVAAVPGQELFEVVACAQGYSQRWLIARADLQPEPGDSEGAVRPQGRCMYGSRGDSTSALLGPHPVRHLDASRTFRHQPYCARKLLAVHDADGKLAPCSRIPL